MKLSALFLSGIAAVIAASTAAVTAGADSAVTGSVSAVRLSAASSGVNVTYRTPDEIRSYLAAHPYSTSSAVKYTREPDLTAPYTDQGELSGSTLQNGLNALNFMRYIAGIPEVTLNSEYTALCQQGSYINAINGGISHSPARPTDVLDSIFEAGSAACGTSNLAMGYTNLAHSVVGYMNDSDSVNIDRLGHRRWCLNPSMLQTGFGQVSRCESMYAFDNSFGATGYTGVCWPAQTMPAELFDSDQAWSYSLGTAIADRSGVKVTLTRNSDGRTWTFSDASANGYFNVENSSYGKPGCVIFRPSGLGGINAGDVFTVRIDGVGTKVDYTVSFFALEEEAKPAAVTGFTASSTTDSVSLSWNKSANADRYQVDVYKNGKWVYLTRTTGTSYKATGLSANTSYKFRIFAFKGSVYSSSTSVTISTKAAASAKPAAVSGFTASPSVNSVSLSWNKNTGADKYQVDVYKNGKWVYLTQTTGTSYTATGLSANTSYKFRIFAFKGSAYSSSASVTVSTKAAASAKPAAVSGFAASSSVNSVSLLWNKSTGADKYQVDVYKNGKWVYLTQTTGTSYTATGLSANTSYKFRIFAFKGSAYSSSTSVTVSTKAAASAKPAAVSGFAASPSVNSVSLSWNKNASADKYQIDIYKDGKWTYLTTTTGTSYTAKGLSEGMEYIFRIFAFKGSSYSGSVRVTAVTKPAAVTKLTAAPADSSIRLSWGASAAADSYQVDIYKNGRWTYLTKTTGTSYNVTGLNSGYIYNFKVYAFKGSSHSSSSSISAMAL